MVADYLSQLESGEAGDDVRDNLSDAQVFRVTTENTVDGTIAEEDKWLTNMHKLLSAKSPLEELNWDEWKRLAVQSRSFCLLQDRFTTRE